MAEEVARVDLTFWRDFCVVLPGAVDFDVPTVTSERPHHRALHFDNARGTTLCLSLDFIIYGDGRITAHYALQVDGVERESRHGDWAADHDYYVTVVGLLRTHFRRGAP